MNLYDKFTHYGYFTEPILTGIPSFTNFTGYSPDPNKEYRFYN